MNAVLRFMVPSIKFFKSKLDSEAATGGVPLKKNVLKIMAKFTGNTCARVSFSMKLQETLAGVFPVNFAIILRIYFSQNTSGRLLL